VTVEFGEGMNLRGSVSRTLARAQLRELAPFSFADYAGGYLVVGNPELGRTRISNYDLRWEWFASPEAVVSLGGFYKKFDDPIETFVLPSTEPLKTWANADGAENYGVELELRSDLGFVTRALTDVSFNGNVTVVRSDVANSGHIRVFVPGTGPRDLAVVARNRPLQGQSPYVANLSLTWAPLGGASASVLFNRFGRRIDGVGSQTTPDIYEEARSQLDAVVEWPIRDGWSAKLSASRLLGNEVEFTQGGGTLRSYDMGRSVSFSLSWGSGR
jgi:outer membrane receptor for ferrienterochelin and colicin